MTDPSWQPPYPSLDRIIATGQNMPSETIELVKARTGVGVAEAVALSEVGPVICDGAKYTGSEGATAPGCLPIAGVPLALTESGQMTVDVTYPGLMCDGEYIDSDHARRSDQVAYDACSATRCFRTGDVFTSTARHDAEGILVMLQHAGREDDLMKPNGIKAYPLEIEDPLGGIDYAAFGILGIYAVGTPSPAGERVTLVIHCRDATAIDAVAFQREMSKYLATVDKHKFPTRIMFAVGDLPGTQGRKVSRSAIKRFIHSKGVPDECPDMTTAPLKSDTLYACRIETATLTSA